MGPVRVLAQGAAHRTDSRVVPGVVPEPVSGTDPYQLEGHGALPLQAPLL